MDKPTYVTRKRKFDETLDLTKDEAEEMARLGKKLKVLKNKRSAAEYAKFLELWLVKEIPDDYDDKADDLEFVYPREMALWMIETETIRFCSDEQNPGPLFSVSQCLEHVKHSVYVERYEFVNALGMKLRAWSNDDGGWDRSHYEDEDSKKGEDGIKSNAENNVKRMILEYKKKKDTKDLKERKAICNKCWKLACFLSWENEKSIMWLMHNAEEIGKPFFNKS